MFAVGSGGNPERHRPFLEALSQEGCVVMAPTFERLLSPHPSESEILSRLEKLQESFSQVADLGLPLMGVGHSIGATLLVGLAGGQIWLNARGPIPSKVRAPLEKLVLIAPPTGYFRAPGALAEICGRVQLWSGTADRITPPEQTHIFKQLLAPKVRVQEHVIKGAGHFSFMNTLPPGVTDEWSGRPQLLSDMARAVSHFLQET